MENSAWDIEEFNFNLSNLTLFLEKLDSGGKINILNVDKELLFNILQYVNFYHSLHAEFEKLREEIRDLRRMCAV